MGEAFLLVAIIILIGCLLSAFFIARKVYLVLKRKENESPMVFAILTFVLTAGALLFVTFLVFDYLATETYSRG